MRCSEDGALGFGSGGIGTERRPQNEPLAFAEAMARQARCAGVAEDTKHGLEAMGHAAILNTLEVVQHKALLKSSTYYPRSACFGELGTERCAVLFHFLRDFVFSGFELIDDSQNLFL